MSDIKISPKHGLNPSVTVCFFCGKSVGVAICGHLKGDQEAPRTMMSYPEEACDECKDWMTKGIYLVGIDPERSDPKKGLNGFYRSGQCTVVSEEAFRRLFDGGAEAVKFGLKHRWTFIDGTMLAQIIDASTD